MAVAAASAPAAAARRRSSSAAPSRPATEGSSSANGAATDASKLSPAVRRIVEENKLDPCGIPASGKDGRLTKTDVVDYLAKGGAPAPRERAGCQAVSSGGEAVEQALASAAPNSASP